MVCPSDTPKTFAWNRPQILLMQKVTKLKQRYGHEAALTHGMKQITIDAVMLTTGRHKTSQSNTRHLEAMCKDVSD
jgi:hypothetical protein